MMQAFYFFTVTLSIAYGAFLFWCLAGWIKLPVYKGAENTAQPRTFVSVIIPARNEESTVVNCLSDFLQQNYLSNLFEVIVVDDHSTDKTAALVEKFISDFPDFKIKLLRMSDGDGKKMYKKQAITEAIKIAEGELIITSDADCRRGKEWMNTLANYYETHHPEMMSAPVVFEKGKNFLEKIQSLELLGLISIGASAIQNKKPFLCNGANLAFSKKIFNEVGGYESRKNISTGDDTQLMLKIAALGKEKIHFVKSSEATVTTVAKENVQEIISQRKRWASKIPVQMNSFTIFIAVIAYLLHASLLLTFFFLFAGNDIMHFLIPFSIKIVSEFMLLAFVTTFFRKSNLLWLFLPSQIIYPFYISIVGVMSLFGTYEWKGRRVQ